MSTIGLAAAFAVAGCGSTSGNGSGAASGVRSAACAPARPAASVTVAARDDHFDPACVTVTPGSTVTIVVRNAGHHPHNLTLAGSSRAHVAVDAGQTGFVTATVGSDDVAFSCTIHPGMRGVLRVDRPSPG